MPAVKLSVVQAVSYSHLLFTYFRRVSLLRRIWNGFRSSWPIQLCLLVLVCIGIVIVRPLCMSNGNINNWRWAWGPQLNYVRGPPLRDCMMVYCNMMMLC